MWKVIFIVIAILCRAFNIGAQNLDNTLYVFNNCLRTLPNAPQGIDAQAEFILQLGFPGIGGHHSEDYFERRESLNKSGLNMPEIYLPATINPDGSITYLDGLRNIIRDSKDRNMLIALAVQSNHYDYKDRNGDKFLVKSIRKLADFAAPYGTKIAVYPHVNFYCERLDHSIELAKTINRPNVGAIFNTCHLFKVEGMENWEQKLKDAIPYLYMISIHGLDGGDTQSMNWDRLIQPLGEGSFDTYQIVKLAKDQGYDGLFGLQCYNIQQDCEVALTKSMNTWRKYQIQYSKQK